MEPMTHPPIPPDVLARRWRILGVLCLSLTIIMIANMSLNLALPSIARELGASTTALQWMVDAYALIFAGLLFAAGTLGDRFGRKGALQFGLGLFLVGTAVAATAQTATAIVAGRAVMGVAAAFVMPSTLSIITNVFPAHERGRAIALWAGVAAGGAALGPTGSGLLLEHFWWGSVFLVNVPLVTAALVLGHRIVPTSRDPEVQPLDVPGVLLSIAGIGALVYAIIEAPIHGWTAPVTLGAFGASAGALALFVRREGTTSYPMLDLRLLRDRRVTVAAGGIGLAFFAMFGVLFLTAQFLQLVLGLSPLEAGLAQLPFSAVMLLMAPQVPRLVARYGRAQVVPAGLGLIALGLVMLSQLGAGSHVALVCAAFVPMAAGIAVTGAPLTSMLMSAVPPGRAGVGSAMNDTSRELGGALGVAVLGSLLTTRFASSIGPLADSLPASARAIAGTGLAGALEVAHGLPGGAGDALAVAARDAFLDGFAATTTVAALLAVVAAVGIRMLVPDADGTPGDEVPAAAQAGAPAS